MHSTYQTVPKLWSCPLPLLTVHTRVYLNSDPARYCYARYKPYSTWPLILPLTVMNCTYQTVSNIWSSLLPLCRVHTREYMTSDPSRYHFARYIPNINGPLIQTVTIFHGTYQKVLDLWSRPLPLRTVHTTQYGTSDTAHYRYARYIPDITWPLIQHVTLCTVHTRQYLTSDPAPYPYARYITESMGHLIHPLTVMYGTYQTVPDHWSSPLPFCTVHTREYLTYYPVPYHYARYIPGSTGLLIQPLNIMHGSYQTVRVL